MKRLRKNGWKFLSDIVMMFLLVLMYNKRVLGMSFHEIGGLALAGLFIIHKLSNRRWIKAVTSGLISTRTPVRQKVYWVLDLLLLLCFAYILFSGILISKVLFPGMDGRGSYKLGHYAVGALALALTGIHAGLHFGWMKQRLLWRNKIPLVLRRVIAIVLSAAVLGFGAYQFTSTAYVNWISNLNVVVFAQSDTLSPGAAALPSDVNNTDETTKEAADITAADTNNDTEAVTITANSRGNGGGGTGLRDGTGPHGSGNGQGAQANADSVVTVLLSFLSILLSFGVVAAWLNECSLKLKQRRMLRKMNGKITPVQP